MKTYAKIQGVSYVLIPFTLSVKAKIKELGTLDALYKSGKISDEDALKKQINFIRDVANCCIFEHVPLENIDINEVSIACISIINAYQNVVTKAKISAVLGNTAITKKKKKRK